VKTVCQRNIIATKLQTTLKKGFRMEDNLENATKTQIATNESLSDLSGELNGFWRRLCAN